MNTVEQRISHIIENYFLYEPLLFAIYCTHRLTSNNQMHIPFRSGRGMLQFSPIEIDFVTRTKILWVLRDEYCYKESHAFLSDIGRVCYMQ